MDELTVSNKMILDYENVMCTYFFRIGYSRA